MIMRHDFSPLADLYRSRHSATAVGWREEDAVRLVKELPIERQNHIQEVVRRSKRFQASSYIPQHGNLPLAAWFHDVGYASSIRTTGFHPLDGAAYLAASGAPDELIGAVFCHTGAFSEARSHSEAAQFYSLYDAESFREPLADALTYCDLHSDPSGNPVTPAERLQEIVKRYGSDHPVTENINRQRDSLFGINREAFRLLVEQPDAHLPWIFTDVDSTLVTPGEKLPDSVHQAILSYQSIGGRISLATGKHPLALKPILDQVTIVGTHIALNGAVVLSGSKVSVLKSLEAPSPLIRQLAEAQIPCVGYTADGVEILNDDVSHDHLQLLADIHEPTPTPARKESTYIKILCFIDQVDAARECEVQELAATHSFGSVRTGRHFFEIIPAGISKGTAMETITSSEDYPPMLTIAVGDAPNDLPMFRRAGFCYAVANGTEEVQSSADGIISSCSQGGVADLLRSLEKKVLL
jgi:Cof subfamily protein (haloacid dehalogenase superfamily)